MVYAACIYYILCVYILHNPKFTGTAPASECNELVEINNSTCNQVYECRITGGGATVWKGSVFDCPASSNEIALLHSNTSIQRSLVCNNGAIVGRLIRAENSTHISQLTVSVSAEMIGMNISCLHDNPGGINMIGSSLLTLTTGNVYKSLRLA